MNRSDRFVAWLFLAPNAVGFAVFVLGPLLVSFAGSFTSWNLMPAAPLEFVGLANYRDMLGDGRFWFYVFNTFYLMIGLPFALAGSLGLALLIHQLPTTRRASGVTRAGWFLAILSGVSSVSLALGGRPQLALVLFLLSGLSVLGFWGGRQGYRALFYLPCFTAGAATMILWRHLLNPHFGLVNRTLGVVRDFVGGSGHLPDWFGSTASLVGGLPLPAAFTDSGFGVGAREALLVMGIWTGIGGNQLILFLAGLTSVPAELYEAAKIDGAGWWPCFRHVTIPHLRPVLFLVTVIAVINGFQGGLEQARILTEGGPAGMTTTLSYYMYVQGFQRLDLGYGCAIAWFIFALIFGATLLQWRLGRDLDHG